MARIYAINLTQGSLVFKGGYINIPRGKFGVITAADKDTEEFIRAEERGWVKFSPVEPREKDLVKVKEVEIFGENKGLTAAELQAEEEVKEEPKVEVTAFGGEETVEVAAEAEAEAEAEAPVEKKNRKKGK